MATIDGSQQVAVGRFETLRAMEDAHAELLRLHRRGDDSTAFQERVQHFLRRGQETGVLLDNDSERLMAQSVLSYWSNTLYRMAGETPDAILAEFDPEQAPELDDAVCPYRCIEAMAADDSGVFAGWRRLTDEILCQLEQHRLVTLVGSSVSGRSVFLQRALLPRLQSVRSTDVGVYRILPILKPGRQPLMELAATVHPAAANDPKQLEQHVERLRQDPGCLAAWIDERPETTVLIVDQFEEIFSECTDVDERRAVADNLFGMAKATDKGRVVLVVNRDFLGRMRQLEALDELGRSAQVRDVYTASELREAVMRPANRVGLKFDDGVVDRLTLHTQGEPAALSLLQFTLERLWEHRNRNRITWEAYQVVGAGGAAIERAADAMYGDLSKEQRGTLRRILLTLVRPVEGREIITRAASRSQLRWQGEPPERVDDVLRRLVKYRLLRWLPDKGTYAIASEALITYWTPLIEWLDDEKTAARQRLRLTEDARHWSETGDASLLWRGLLLDQALLWEVDDPLESEFVAVSRAAAEAERTRAIRRLSLVSAVLFLLFLAATSFFLMSKSRGRSLTNALAQRYVMEASTLLNRASPRSGSDIGGALLWTTEALGLHEKVDRSRAQVDRVRLNAALQQLPRLQRVFYFDGQTSPDFGGGGELLVIAGSAESAAEGSGDKTARVIRVWDTGSGAVAAQAVNEESVRQLTMKPSADSDAALIAVAGGANGSEVVRVWRFDRGGRDARLQQIWSKSFAGKVRSAVFSPVADDLRVLVVVDQDDQQRSEAWVLDSARPADQGEAVRLFDAETRGHATITQAAFSRNGERALTVISALRRGADTVKVWETSTGRLVTQLDGKHASPIAAAVFSPDGTTLVTATEDGNARIFDADRGDLLETLHHNAPLTSAEFTPDGERVVTSTDDGLVRVWRWKAPSPPSLAYPPLEHGKTTVFRTAASPDGRLLVTCSRDRKARVWDLTSGQMILPPLDHSASVVSAFFSRDGGRLLTHANTRETQHTLRVWELTTGNPPPVIAPTRGDVRIIALTDDGAVLVTGGSVPQAEAEDSVSRRGEVGLWLTATGAQVRPPFNVDAPVKLVATSREGTRLLVVTERGTDSANDRAQLWKDVQSDEFFSVREKLGVVNAACISPSGRYVAFACDDATDNRGIVWMWDTTTSKAVSVLQSPTPARSVAFDPLERYLAAGFGIGTPSASGAVMIWNLRTQRGRALEAKHVGPVTHVEFSRQGGYLATASEDDTARVWDMKSGTPSPRPLQHTADVTHVTISPDELRVMTASRDQTAKIWDLATGDSLATLVHMGSVSQAMFSPPGTPPLALTVSNDGAARLWEAETGDLVGVMPQVGDVELAAFAESGRLVTAGRRTVTSTRQLVAEPSSSLAPRNLEPLGQRALAAVWDVAPVLGDYSTAQLRKVAQTVSARQIDEVRGVLRAVTPLEPRQASEQWQYLDEAERELISQGPPSLPPAQTAQQCETLGQWYAAVWHLSRAIEETPKQALLYHRRARARAELELWDQAIEDYQTALRLGVADRNVLLGLTDAYLKTDQWKEAVAVVTKAVEQTAGEQDAADSRADLLLRRAWAHQRLGTWNSAAADYSQALEMKPLNAQNMDIWKQRHALYAEAGKWHELIEVYRQAIDRHAGHPLQWWLWRQLAWAYEAAGQWKQAAEAYGTVIAIKTDDISLLEARARAHGQAGDMQAAARDLQRLIDVQPDYARGHYILAVVHLSAASEFGPNAYRHDCQKMLAEFQNTNDSRTANLLAWTCSLGPHALATADDYDDVIALAVRNLAAEPGKQHLLNTLGASLYRAGRYEEAIEALHASRLAFVRPTPESTQLERGIAPAGLALQQRPLASYGQASQLRDDDGTVWDFLFLAMSHQALGREAEQRGASQEAQERRREARKWLQLAKRKYEDDYSTAGQSSDANDWYIRMEVRALYEEARDLIEEPQHDRAEGLSEHRRPPRSPVAAWFHFRTTAG